MVGCWTLAGCAGEEFSSSGGTSSGGSSSGGGSSGGSSGGTSSGGTSSGGTSSGGTSSGGSSAGGAAGADGGCPDLDNDKQTACDGDCDDTDPSVWLGGAEVCGDAKDNDCTNGPDDGCNGLGTFVSASVGSDSNPGTQAKPVKTIMKGIANADAIRTGRGQPSAKIDVFIAQGVYTEKVKLLEGVSLIGGHECNASSCTWSRNPAAYESKIVAVDFEGTLADASITRATRLEDLTLEGKDGSPPGGTFGAAALMLDGGRPTVKGCKILGPDVTGAWPQGRSAGIFIAWSNDTVGALIEGNDISGGSAVWAHGILMADLPNKNQVGQAEIVKNTIQGGTGTKSTEGVGLHNAGPGTLVHDNDIAAGTSQEAWAFGVSVTTTAAIDANRINLPGTLAKCAKNTAWCGGIVCESCSGSITNNVVFGADAPRSVAIQFAEVEKPAGDVVVHSNYANGAGNASTGSESAGMVLEIGTCSTCGFKGKFGRIRNNIIEVGVAPGRCGVVELAPAGKQVHPEAFEFNFFSALNPGPTPCRYSLKTGSTPQTLILSSAPNVDNTLPTFSVTATSNLEGDPIVDAMNKHHLKPGSPCINAGTPKEAPPKDMDGQSRPMGKGHDIGPDEAG